MLVADSIHKTYRKHRVAVPVLNGLSLTVHPGEFLSLVGASGSVPDSMRGRPADAATASTSRTSTPSRSSHQVIARNIAPVSR